MEAYIDAVAAELRLWRDRLGVPLRTIYLGGGTPTALPAELLERLLGELTRLIGPAGQFSIEANPATITAQIAEVLAGAGVNRVTVGAQSFDAAELKLLGRIHTPSRIAEALEILRRVGIGNIGLDLIYGIPGQLPDDWQRSLAAAVDLGVEHLSCYGLSFEPGTELEAMLAAGEIDAVDDEIQREMYYRTREILAAAGLEQYEISNFAKAGCQSQHNLTYWRNESYIGLGPSACSYLDGVRRSNTPDLEAYLTSLRDGQQPPADSEKLTVRPAMAETLMLGLRLTDGVEIERFARRFGLQPAEAFPVSFKRYESQGTLVRQGGCIRLNPEAYFTSDAVLADIIAEAGP